MHVFKPLLVVVKAHSLSDITLQRSRAWLVLSPSKSTSSSVSLSAISNGAAVIATQSARSSRLSRPFIFVLLALKRPCVQVDARILEPPKVEYGARGAAPGRETTVRPHQGSWDLRGVQFSKPATLNSYGIACLTAPDRRQEQDLLVRFPDPILLVSKSLNLKP